MAMLATATLAVAGSHDQEKMPPMSAEDQKMMEAMMKAGTPGAEHAHLMARAGTWDATVSSWMKPGTPPMVSQAKAERKAVMGGRILEEHWSGNMMGAPFEGHGMAGFDNVSKKYWNVWMDNMGTGMMMAEGSCDMAKKSCTYWGSYNDPMSGKPAKTRTVVTWTGADDEKMEMYMPGPDGKEYKGMEIVAKRAGKMGM
jgi:hypothetical protein